MIGSLFRRTCPLHRHSSGVLALALLITGCISSGPKAQEPAWWGDTHKNDFEYLYFKAKGESQSSSEEARTAAQSAIKAQIAEYILSGVAVSDVNGERRVRIESAVKLREVEVFEEVSGRSAGKWVGYMLGRYPRSEYEKLRTRLELAEALASQWSTAQSAFNRGDLAEAEKQLLRIINTYDSALNSTFAIEEAKLLLARTYLKQNYGVKARKWINDVRLATTSEIWRAQAEALASQIPPVALRDAFDGEAVAVFSWTRKDGSLVPAPELENELSGQLAKGGVDTLGLTASSGPVVTVDKASLVTIGAMAANKQARVAFIVVMDVDSRKTGQQIEIPGTNGQTMEAYDAKLTYYIVRSSDGEVLASDSTVGPSTASRSMINTILKHRRHLPAHAARVLEMLQSNAR